MRYLWLVPLLPLIGSILNGLFGFRFSKKIVGAVACGATGLSFLVALVAFRDLLALDPSHRYFKIVLFDWIKVGSFLAEAGLQLDQLSGVMMLVVTGVGFLIHVYSIGYMSEEFSYPRYFAYLNLFMFSMLVLILGSNFLVMFIGWEGVGLCSYLLIGYYYEKKSAGDAGKKAFIMNRVGDFGFLLAVILISIYCGSIDYNQVFSEANHNLEAGGLIVTAITMLLFVGACGKSAQIPLYTWLPDAMEGPTPVSALIHAATMVTAGVYMVVRCNVLFVMAPTTMSVVAIVGAITAIFAASIGLCQNDIKRVLAYSTVSQLGYMFLACGIGAFTAAIFHVVTHAFFKACLFLGSGSVIHSLHGAKDPQDMRTMGNLKGKLPKTYMTFLVSTLALSGIFPFAGFFSKDEILWKAISGGYPVLWALGAGAAFMTAFYMFRLVFMTFHGESRVESEVEHHIHESPGVMTTPLLILAFFACTAGLLGLPAVMGPNVFHHFLAPIIGAGHEAQAAHGDAHANHALEWVMMGISLSIAACGIFMAYVFYIKAPHIPAKISESVKWLHAMVFNKYYIDELYDAVIVQPLKNVSRLFLWKIFDVRIIDGLVNDIGNVFVEACGLIRRYQTGFVRNYAFSMVFGFGVMVFYYILN